MNRYYLASIMSCISLSTLQSMEIDKKPLITGSIFIDGPAICYGPGTYYNYNLRNVLFPQYSDFNFYIEEFEPLVKVGIIIDDMIDDNNPIQNRWVGNVPHIIRQSETKSWQRDSHTTDKPDSFTMQEIEKKCFPSYIPVRLLKDITQNNNILKLLVHFYDVSLKCIPNPSYNLIDQINHFIKTPSCFACQIGGSYWNPIEQLLSKRFIKEAIKEETSSNKLPEKEDFIDQFATRFKIFAADITKMIDQEEAVMVEPQVEWREEGHCEQMLLHPLYEHGEKGKEVVEQLKVTFAHLLPLTGKVLLWPQSDLRVLVPDVRTSNQSIKEEEKIYHVPPYPLAVQNFGY